ncbi:maestro heat-like repeat-containing protein family member 7 [Diceros bicornis minor]|uniref:maestro heat-like repeat-containing protein family member 7 n=1 Tax=Diceros bicornis minor TaxID=77932 RepID=UPI0026EBB468|nr:maestro heat-like repeat-containing protein family member 7 [Diceros bicornis minor]
MVLKPPMPEIGKVAALRDFMVQERTLLFLPPLQVPEIIQYIYHNMNSVTEATAQATIKEILHLLAQTYTDEVILTLFKMEDHSARGIRKPWEILASFPKGYEVIMDYLLHRLAPHQKSRGREPSRRTEISPLIPAMVIGCGQRFPGDGTRELKMKMVMPPSPPRPQATRAIHQLLLEPSRRIEVQTFFPSLLMALLFQVSFLVVEGDAEMIPDQQHVMESVDPVSSTVEALKTLMRSTGYGDHVSYVQKLGGWELLTSPETYYEGVTLLARAMVVKNCWHNCPVFSLTVRILQELDHTNHLTALGVLTELLRCPNVAATVDEVTVHVLANWFQFEEPATVKLLLRVVEIFAKHGNMVKWGRGRGRALKRCRHSGKE